MKRKRNQDIQETFTAVRRIGAFLLPQLALFIPVVVIWSAQDFVLPYFLARLQGQLTEFALKITARGFWDIVLEYVLSFSLYMAIFCIAAYLTMSIEEQSKCRIWNQCFRKLLRARNIMKTDDAMIRFSNDVTAASISTYGTISSLLQGIIALAGSLAVVLQVHWLLALTAVLLGFLNVWMKKHFVGRFKTAGQEIREAETAIQEEITDNIANKIAVRMFLLAGRRGEELSQRLRNLALANERKVVLDTRYAMLDYCRKWMAYSGICLIGGFLIFRGQLTLPNLILALGVLPQIVMKIGFLIDILVMYQSSIPACNRVIELLDLEEETMGVPLPETAPQMLSFDHVTFRYPERNQDVLRGISFSLRKGEKVALVGGSGSGKSTILKLASGELRPGSGTIALDGINLDEADPCQWRRCFGCVGQAADLLPGTVRENVLMGKEDASEQELEEALESAGASDFISGLSVGADSVVEGEDTALSGGQRQRIALARALMRRNGILCLDEITSAQDTLLREQMAALLSESSLTILAATNDPAFARSFDRVIRLEGTR